MSDVYRSYTASEKWQRTKLILRGSKQAIADAVDPKIERRIQRLDDRAEERGAREAKALLRQDNQAKNDLATARVAERAARRGPERDAAKADRKAAEERARHTESAIRRAGLA